jgi:hypothetical protein
MPAREQTTAGESVRVIRDISKDLDGILPEFEKHECIVIISRYSTGKSTSAAKKIISHFGEDGTEYITLTRQDKENDENYIKPTIKFGEVPKGKTIIFDELHSDEGISKELIDEYFRELLKRNRVIILTNPYGSGEDVEHEIVLFKKQEKKILPEDTLFIFVTNKKE